jgi:3-oxoadipate enol-lactonase
MPFCKATDGVGLYYEDFGDGLPIVFTAAGSTTHRMWEGQVAALAGRYRTIAYDWRGTGNSDKPRGGYAAEALAADLCALIERLELAPAVLIGHGLGSHVCLLAATERPELAKALVLVSTAPWMSGERDGAVGGVSEEFLSFLGERTGMAGGHGIPYPQALADMSEQWLFHRPQPPAVHAWLLEQAMTWPQFVINAYARGMHGLDHRARFGRVRCPTLVIQGRHDRKQRYEGAAYVAGRIRGARLLTLEHSAHMGEIEELDTFNRALISFVQEVEGARQVA